MYQKLILVFILIFLTACQSALLARIRENDKIEQRIILKKQELGYLDNQNRVLLAEKKNLLTEIDQKEMTLDELYARLNNLEKQNGLLKTASDKQKQKKMNFEKQMGNYKDEIDNLRNSDKLSIEEKEKKIESLRKEIKTYLQLGL